LDKKKRERENRKRYLVCEIKNKRERKYKEGERGRITL
jgi:hypothetical protein